MSNKKVLLENKRASTGIKKTLMEKRVILGIKGHFWEVEGHNDLRTRAIATSLPPLEWSFLDVSIQNKISKMFLEAPFFYGSDILTLKFPEISP